MPRTRRSATAPAQLIVGRPAGLHLPAKWTSVHADKCGTTSRSYASLQFCRWRFAGRRGAPRRSISPQTAWRPPPRASKSFCKASGRLPTEKGISRATFDAAFAGLEPDPAAPAASERQAEFDKPLKSYLNEAVSPRRIARGRECLNRWHDELQQIERRFGVPREILLAAFGIETDFGKAKGEKDVVRSLATLAYSRQDRPVFRDELIERACHARSTAALPARR